MAFNAESFAASKTHSKKSKKTTKTSPVRKEMNSISGHIRDLGLYIASEQEFVRESNKPIIQKHLEELTKIFKNVKVLPEYDG